MENPDKIIEIKKLHKYYGAEHVLDGIDFSVRRGELISIIGRSGCGKTTLLRCINCLEIFDHGIMRVGDITLKRLEHVEPRAQTEDIANNIKKWFNFSEFPDAKGLNKDFQNKAHEIRANVGMLFQDLNLFPHLKVQDNVAKALVVVKGINPEEAIDRAEIALEKVNMDKFMDRYPSQLSGGQAQRVAIARALAMSPEVMLYDEPTSALDPELVEEVLQVMRRLHEEGMTQIVVTHAMNFARTASDYVGYMDNGQIIEFGPPAEMFDNPKDRRTQQYLSILE
ncbi:MAG: amino acid ABC transporter ATP-binding protein [Candidatus Kapaibacterium sp.]